MHPSTILATLAALPLAFSIPSRHYKRQDTENATDNTSPISACSLSGVAQPPSTLTPPPAGTNLVLIAHGVGTQNYTCGANLTAPPSSIGAIATLSDFSCSLSNTPNPASKASPPSPDAEPPTFGTVAESATIGTHFFVDNTTPDFDIIGLGNTQMKKKEDCNAPNPAADVKWLLLTTQAQGTTSQVKMIYRLNTQGGLVPKNCEGRAAGDVVTVPYEAQYWVYAFLSSGNTTANGSVAIAPVAPQSPPQQPAAEQYLGAGSRGREVNGWMVLVSFALYMFCL